MTFRNIRPLHIMWQAGIEKEMLKGVISGVERVLSLAGVFQEFKLEQLGQRRQPDWLNHDGTLLNPYQSLDWHIEWARRNSQKAGHLNVETLFDSLAENPTHQTEPRYELVVVNEPIHSNDVFRIFGIARPNHGALITLYSKLHLLQPVVGETDEDRKKRQSDFWFLTELNKMHELSHVFCVEAHCLNECVMYWQEDADLYRKIQNNPFCPSCLEKLKQYFIAP